MKYHGVLKKMTTEFNDPIEYYLWLGNDFLNVNQLLNKRITIDFIKYECLNCGNDKPIYRQGYCQSCFFEIPEAADWIIRPELSTAHLDEEDRDLDFEKRVQLQPHVVYLANSCTIKVGVTRKAQLPTRWIDQGAHEAIEIVEAPNRYLAGITEVALKEHLSDKTNWRAMVKNEIKDENLAEWRDKLEQYIPEEAREYFIKTNQEQNFSFPVLSYPKNPKSLNLVKQFKYSGVLKGIKGQYFIFDDDTVFNVRSSEGLVVDLEVKNN